MLAAGIAAAVRRIIGLFKPQAHRPDIPVAADRSVDERRCCDRSQALPEIESAVRTELP
jgi:hypothetical protein